MFFSLLALIFARARKITRGIALAEGFYEESKRGREMLYNGVARLSAGPKLFPYIS